MGAAIGGGRAEKTRYYTARFLRLKYLHGMELVSTVAARSIER